MLERLRERKQDLKHQVSELQQELDESKKAHRYVKKWDKLQNFIVQYVLQNINVDPRSFID